MTETNPAGAGLSELAIAVAAVKLEPGQILVVTFPDRRQPMTLDQAERIRDAFAAAFKGAGVPVAERRILIAGERVELAVVDANNAEA